MGPEGGGDEGRTAAAAHSRSDHSRSFPSLVSCFSRFSPQDELPELLDVFLVPRTGAVAVISRQRAHTAQRGDGAFETEIGTDAAGSPTPFYREVELALLFRLNLPRWRRGAVRDPELRKILLRVLACTLELRRLVTTSSEDKLPPWQTRVEETLTLITASSRLDLHTAIEILDSLDQELLLNGDEEFIAKAFLLERYRDAKNVAQNVRPFGGPFITWHTFIAGRNGAVEPGILDVVDLSGELKDLLRLRTVEQTDDLRAASVVQDSRSGATATAALRLESIQDLRRWLSALRWARSSEFRLDRARQRMRERALSRLAVLLAVLTGGLSFAISRVTDELSWNIVLLVALSGALGGVLAGVLKLRDDVARIGNLRILRPAVYVQPLLGAASGLLMLLILVSGFLTQDSSEQWAKDALLAFIAGFSEPYFLGIVNRVVSATAPQGVSGTKATQE
jgi:hypothetical protein